MMNRNKQLQVKEQHSQIEDEFFSYVKCNWKLIVSVYLVTFAIYGSWLVKDIVTFDAEALYNPQFSADWYNQWFRLGRWMLVFLKNIFGVSIINPYFSSMVFFIGFPASIIMWIFLFETWAKKQNFLFRLVFFIVYLSHPIWALMFSYRMHMEVLVAVMCMLPVGIAFFIDWIENNSVSSGIFAFFMVVCCFGSFQSFMFMFADACAMYVFLRHNQTAEITSKSLWKIIIKMLLFTISAFMCWYVVSRVACKMYGQPYGDAYLSNQFLWGTRPAIENIRTIIHDISESMFGNGREYSVIYGIVTILFFVRCIVNLVQKKSRALSDLLSAICIWGIPYALVIVTGYPIVIRSRYAFVLSCAFMTAIDLMWIAETASNRTRIKRLICAALTFFLILPQTQITTRLLYTDVRVMEQDLRMFGDVFERAMQMGAKENYSLYFSGKRGNPGDESLLEVEVVGFSYSEVNNSNKNIQAMRAYGFNVLPATQEQMEIGELIAQELTVWPDKGAMKVLEEERLIVVNLE